MPDHTPEDRIHPETWTFRASATLAGRPETDPAVIRNWLLTGPLSEGGYRYVRLGFVFRAGRASPCPARTRWASATLRYPTSRTHWPATARAFATDSLGWPSGSIASVSEIIVAAGAQ